MEAGGLEITEESQDVYRGTNVGLEYFDLDICRLRYFGGTSNHWGGWSRALDAVDFTPKPWVPLSRLADRPARPRPLPRRGRRDPRRPRRRPRRPTCRSARRPTTSAASSSASARRPASPRSTGPRSRPPTGHRLVLNANLVDLRLDDGSTTVDRRGLPQLRPRRPRLHRPGPRLRALHRRHRERAAPAQLHQPDPRGHRQPHRHGRPLLRRPPALPARRVSCCQRPACASGSSTPRPSLHARARAA